MTRPVTSWSRKRCYSVYYWDKFLKDCQVSPDKLKPNFIQSFLVLEISCSNVKWNFVDHATYPVMVYTKCPRGRGCGALPYLTYMGVCAEQGLSKSVETCVEWFIFAIPRIFSVNIYLHDFSLKNYLILCAKQSKSD